MSFSDYGINFPVTQSLTSFDFSRTLVFTHTVRQFTPSIVAAVAFTALLLATQMPVEITSILLIS